EPGGWGGNLRRGARLPDPVTRLFGAQRQPPEAGASQPAYARVVPPPGTPPGEGPLLLAWPDGEPPAGRADARRELEAGALAALVRQAVAAGAWAGRDRGRAASPAARHRGVVGPLRPPDLTG